MTTVSPVRQALRALALVAVLAAVVGSVPAWPLATRRGRVTLVTWWCRAVLRVTGVRLVREPHPGDDASITDTALVTCNHVSWLDIPVLLVAVSTPRAPMPVVAKSEVRDWPVIGFLAARIGTVFIDRARLRRLPTTVAQIAEHLRHGRSVLVFPEGTTGCGSTVGIFRPAMFQAAVDSGAPVRPVALRYHLPDGGPAVSAAFIDDDTLIRSVRRVIAIRGLVVTVRTGPLVRLADLPATWTEADDTPTGAGAGMTGRWRARPRRALADCARAHVTDSVR